MQLVRGWRTWPHQVSTWLALGGSAIITFTPEFTEVLHYVWINLPTDIKTTFHEEWIRGFGLVLTVLSVPAKLIRQRKLYEREFSVGKESESNFPRQSYMDGDKPQF